MAIGHTRYSTTGGSRLANCSPIQIETIYGPLAVAHNGNLTNAFELRAQLLDRGVGLSSTTDSEVITQVLAGHSHSWAQGHPDGLDKWERRLWSLAQRAEGAYSLVILTQAGVYAIRDPHGLRPLVLGRLDDGGYVVASETSAFMTIGAELIREVAPGEMLRINEDGVRSTQVIPESEQSLCIFEYVYFARPDSVMEGQVIHQVRQRMGRRLAEEAPADADLVVPVPDSAFPAAIGFAQASGIPFSEGLTKNRYIGRTFIQPDDRLRKSAVRLKYNPLSANLAGKRVVLVDDSIVRGNTAGPLVQLLRDGGAAEVHVRVSSPPVRHPCFMGIDMATYRQLIAHRLDVEGIRRHIGADSLAYLSLPGMEAAVREALPADRPTGHCTACFSGRYPVDVPAWLFAENRDQFALKVLANGAQ